MFRDKQTKRFEKPTISRNPPNIASIDWFIYDGENWSIMS